MINSAAFDAFAGTYDQSFTNSRLGRLLRSRVWQLLSRHFSAGQHLLELACGTGEDAVWLAKQGCQITATDGSAEMVRLAQAKVQAVGLSGRVEIAHLSLQEVAEGNLVGSFDGVYTNFGGLNTIAPWRPLAQALARLVRPGGKLLLVPMGPLCPWEVAWYVGHGRLGEALRRWRQPAPAKIGPVTIPIWYPSARRLRRDFAPWFDYAGSATLGLWLPPSYLDHLVERWPTFFAKVNQFEQATASLCGGWGDHYIIIFEKKA